MKASGTRSGLKGCACRYCLVFRVVASHAARDLFGGFGGKLFRQDQVQHNGDQGCWQQATGHQGAHGVRQLVRLFRFYLSVDVQVLQFVAWEVGASQNDAHDVDLLVFWSMARDGVY